MTPKFMMDLRELTRDGHIAGMKTRRGCYSWWVWVSKENEVICSFSTQY